MTNNYIDFLNEYKQNKRYEKHYEDFNDENFDIVITKEFIGMLSDTQVDLLSMEYLHREIKELLYSINKEYELDNTIFEDKDILDIYEKLYRVKFQLDKKSIEFMDIANRTDREFNWFDLIIYFDNHKPLDKKFIEIARIFGGIDTSLLLIDGYLDRHKYRLVAESGELVFTVNISVRGKQAHLLRTLMKHTKDNEIFSDCSSIDDYIEKLTKNRWIYENIVDYFNNNKEYIGKVLGE